MKNAKTPILRLAWQYWESYCQTELHLIDLEEIRAQWKVAHTLQLQNKQTHGLQGTKLAKMQQKAMLELSMLPWPCTLGYGELLML